MNTRVIKLGSDLELFYSIPPEMAVVAAYEQYEKGNWNTWTYPAPRDHPEFRVGKFSVACGDFTSRVDMTAYYIKPTSSTCYDSLGVTFPVVIPVNWREIMHGVADSAWISQFGWNNQPTVLCFKASEGMLTFVEQRLKEAIPWSNLPVVVECDFWVEEHKSG